MGDGIAAYATGDFYADDAPEVTLRRPGRHWHLAKVAFEKYWLKRWFPHDRRTDSAEHRASLAGAVMSASGRSGASAAGRRRTSGPSSSRGS